MWTSERGRLPQSQEPAAEVGVVTLGGNPAAVEFGGERRWLPVCAPGGYSWQPGAGDKVLVLKAGVERESPYILGKIQENVEEAGPIRLFGPGSALGLDQGRVELEGTVYLNGQTLEAYIQKIVAEMLG